MATKTKDEVIQDLAVERDAALKALTDADADRKLLEAWAKAEIEKARAACPPPEAGVSLNVTLQGKTITTAQLTLRHPDHEKAADILESFRVLASNNGWAWAAPPKAAPEPKPVAIAREAGGEEAAQNVKRAMADNVPAGELLTLDCEKVKVYSEQEGRVTIDFFEKASNKWADKRVKNWKLDSASGLLKHITDTAKIFVKVNGQDVVVPAELAVACRVYYALGDEYTKSKGPNVGQKARYENVEHVRPIA